MKLFKHGRPSTKDMKNITFPKAHIYQFKSQTGPQHGGAAAEVPLKVLKIIFTFVCPHVLDEEYISYDNSMTYGRGSGCSPCDMRDLAHCALVNKAWAVAAQNSLYHSIRLDSVHCCAREPSATEKRRSRFGRHGDPKNPAVERLLLLQGTVKANGRLASLIQILKMPYMARETCLPDLARTVSVLPKLRYIDLPRSFFRDDPKTKTLRLELQRNCPDIRKMKYLAGSEASFSMLAQTGQWRSLESIELNGLRTDAAPILNVLASLFALCHMSIIDMPSLDDTLFQFSSITPPFPALRSLTLSNSPAITASGLIEFFSRPEARGNLTRLELDKTGVSPEALYKVLAIAPNIESLKINGVVTRSFPLQPIPLIASKSLRTLHYEITPSFISVNVSSEAYQVADQPPHENYYTYLATSLLSGSLPLLTALYAFSPSLIDILSTVETSIYSPLAPSQRPQQQQPLSSTSNILPGLSCPLELYTKPAEAPDLEWRLTVIDPGHEQNHLTVQSDTTRPISFIARLGRNVSSHPTDATGSSRRAGESSTPGGIRGRDHIAVPEERDERFEVYYDRPLGAKNGEAWLG